MHKCHQFLEGWSYFSNWSRITSLSSRSVTAKHLTSCDSAVCYRRVRSKSHPYRSEKDESCRRRRSCHKGASALLAHSMRRRRPRSPRSAWELESSFQMLCKQFSCATENAPRHNQIATTGMTIRLLGQHGCRNRNLSGACE